MLTIMLAIKLGPTFGPAGGQDLVRVMALREQMSIWGQFRRELVWEAQTNGVLPMVG